jgi:hypothetical protein
MGRKMYSRSELLGLTADELGLPQQTASPGDRERQAGSCQVDGAGSMP